MQIQSYSVLLTQMAPHVGDKVKGVQILGVVQWDPGPEDNLKGDAGVLYHHWCTTTTTTSPHKIFVLVRLVVAVLLALDKNVFNVEATFIYLYDLLLFHLACSEEIGFQGGRIS